MVTTAKGSEVWIDSMLILSTAHMSESTSRLLTDPNAEHPCMVILWPCYGWIVWCDTDLMRDDETDYPDLRACFALAAAMGCAWVRFDCDADPIPDLPTYTWTDDNKPAGMAGIKE